MTAALRQSLIFSLLSLVLIISNSPGQAPYRVASAYEDTVRVAVVWNDPIGNQCGNAALHQPVGEKTRNFVVQAIDTTQVDNVRVLKNTVNQTVSWADIQNLWGGDSLPHVIVHVNAGWNLEYNNSTLRNMFNQAVSNHIGVVSIGDDAATLATNTFGFSGVDNIPAPLGDANGGYGMTGGQQSPYIDSLWIGLIRENDDGLKVYDDDGLLEYPYVNGVISNAIDSIFDFRSIVQFKERDSGRCQADADRYSIAYPEQLTMLGYQQGYLSGRAQPDRNNDLNVLVALQDTVANDVIRRGVSLSFQPQFLEDSEGIEQIVYDAVMFASLAHTLSVPTRLIISTEDDTLTAGEIDTLYAYVIDQGGDTITDATTTIRIAWNIQDPHPGDRFINDNSHGDQVLLTATEAYRFITVHAEIDGIRDSARIWVEPGPPSQLVIEGSSNPPLTTKSPIGGNSSVTIGASQTEARGYAVLRDSYDNFVELSTNTAWDTLRPSGIVSVDNGDESIGEGIIEKLGPSGVTRVSARDVPSSFKDTIQITVEDIEYDSLRIMQYSLSQGRLVRITSLEMSTSDSTVLYVEGLRRDRLGPPGSGGWVEVSGNWSTSAALQTSPTAPSGQYAWGFSPVDTGHGTITVRLNDGPQTSIPAVFTTGAPRLIVLYPAAGDPAELSPHAQPSLVADTATAGRYYTLLYAKVFDENNYWLSQYETNTALAQQIQWSVTPTVETTLSSASGNSNRLRSTRAYTQVKIKVTLNAYSDSVLIYIQPDTATHIVIEASPTITNLYEDDPLNRLVIRSEQTVAYAYAILRDAYGNYVGYSNPTTWSSVDTPIVIADTALTAIGEGIVQRVADNGETRVIATDVTKNFKDTLDVELQNIYYKQLRISIFDPGPKFIDSITVRTDETRTLFVEGQRSDNDIWENVDAEWTIRGTLRTTDDPPRASDQWDVTPDTTGIGWIKVTLVNALPDSVFATFIPGLPGSMAIYEKKGNPLAQVPYPVPPQIDTIIAGEKIPLIAAIFDRKGIWLEAYSDSIKSLPLISWSIQRVSGSSVVDTLAAENGYINAFTPTQAYTTYMISATFDDGINEFRAQLQVYILPGLPFELVIESTADITGSALYDKQPMSVIEFGLRDTIQNGVAIIRDKFGNFIQHSKSTRWNSLDSLIVIAAESVPEFGVGKVTRIGTLGTTKVVAVNRSNPDLFDTVDVKLSDFAFDALRIVVNDSIDITTLEMRLDQDTTLQVLGERSFDGAWIPVDANWNYTSTTESQSQSMQKSWAFMPTDTGYGKIIVTNGSAIPDTVNVRINPGLPSKLVLYAREGLVPDPSNPPYADPVTEIDVIAGTPFPLVAKALDANNIWLPDFENRIEQSRKIKWRVLEIAGNDSSGFVVDTAGHKNSFIPVRAYRSVLVAAELQLDNNQILLDTVRLHINPGEPAKLVIEGSPTVNINFPNPLDTARITDSTTSARIYAILRDSIGNFVDYSKVTSWGVVNNDTAVSISKGNTNTGEGVVSRRIRDGVVKVYGVDASGLRDSTVVKMLPYYFKELRIVVDGNATPDSLVMNTNQDTSVTVQGLRSDSLIWVDLEARWENSDSLVIDPSAPGWDHEWTFSPGDTGRGWIRVTTENDTTTLPDTLFVTFTPGPPTDVTIEILTPPEERIAGEPIEVVVTIRNEDGLVPGKYCFNDLDSSFVMYTDTLGTGGRPQPFVFICDSSETCDTCQQCDTFNLAEKGLQCFYGGTDTIETVLFYATDSLHRVSVDLGELHARTMPFILHPGPLDSLVLEDPLGNPVGDTVTLSYPTGRVTMVAVGYDRYGNRIGPIDSDWDTDGTLHDIHPAERKSKVIYQASDVNDNEAGTIIAVPSDSIDPKIKADVYVKIIGPLITLVSAETRDANGNGYLDQMVLHFSKPVDIPEDYSFEDILIKKTGTVFTVKSIVGAGEGADSVWVLNLDEKKTNEPQTNWVPEVSFGRDLDINIDSASVTAVDGAGPVVWKVVKEIKDPDDVAQDEITITFSEPVQRATGEGQNLTTADSVKLLFYVWSLEATEDGGSEYVILDSMFINISDMQSVSEKEVMFLTTDSSDLAPHHYISIRMWTDSSSDSSYITDRADQPNLPEVTNQRVRVIVQGPAPKLVIAPNPTRPTERYVRAGKLEAKNYPDAWRWVNQENSGAMMQFSIVLPSGIDTMAGGGIDPRDVKIKCVEKIYDFVGNLVNSAVNDDLAKTFTVDDLGRLGSRQKVSLYWNCFTKTGRPASPGIYRVVIHIEYTDSRFKNHNKTHVSVLGIGR